MGLANVNTGLRQKPKFSVAIQTDTYQKLINNTLGDPTKAQRFVAAISSAVAVNPALQECDAGSILAGALLGESLNLSPSPQLGQYYLVPFKVAVKGPDGKKIYKTDEQGNKLKDDKGRWIPETEAKATFVLGYKGYIQLAIRSGFYADIDVMEVRLGEYLGKNKYTGKPMFEFVEDDDKRDELPVIGYMAHFEYLNGFQKTLYWSKTKMIKHADKYSPAFNMIDYEKFVNGEIPDNEMWKYSSYWYQDFDGMARKTMLRQLIGNWGIMSTEMQMAVSKDNEVQAISENADAEAEEIPVVEVAEPEFVGVGGQVDLDSL